MAEDEKQAGDETLPEDDPSITGICPHCDEEMTQELGEFVPGTHEQMAQHEMGMHPTFWRCENVDCPARDVDMAKANPNGGS